MASPHHPGEVPDPRPELGIAINMEVVISCMVSELMSTALGTRPAADIGGGESPVGEGVEMIGNAARCEKTAEGEKRGQYGSVSINMPPPISYPICPI